MQMCEPHYAALRTEIENQGMASMIPETAEQARASVITALEEAQTGVQEGPFDPLLTAVFQIYGNAVRTGGLYLLAGDYCPLCEVRKHVPAAENNADALWISGCVTAIAEHVRENGLLKPPN